jgi:hypothetical protein
MIAKNQLQASTEEGKYVNTKDLKRHGQRRREDNTENIILKNRNLRCYY